MRLLASGEMHPTAKKVENSSSKNDVVVLSPFYRDYITNGISESVRLYIDFKLDRAACIIWEVGCAVFIKLDHFESL